MGGTARSIRGLAWTIWRSALMRAWARRAHSLPVPGIHPVDQRRLKRLKSHTLNQSRQAK